MNISDRPGFDDDIENCLRVLKQGGLILYPTDTVWGIGCDATNSAAVERVYRLKQRADNKAMIILAATERDILKYTANTDLSVFDYLRQVKKPTTVIYDMAVGLAENLPAEDGSIAIRICQDPFCKQLIKRFRKPVVSTSANFSGEKTPAAFGQIRPGILNGVDYVVKYRQDDTTPASPSAIIKWINGQPVVVRP
jgi:L-threonylcarbamoyladenylate synthase